MISQNVRVSSEMLQIKSVEFAKKLGYEKFCGSLSWVYRFRQRHNIVFGKVVGEAASAPTHVANDWIKNVWPTIRDGYADDDVFNADETGLFFKATPDKCLRFKGEKCVGGKMSKDRISVMLAANLNGTEKKKLLVIGKAKQPRCFKHKPQLPVDYYANSRAWMTSSIFEDYLQKWDQQLISRRRKIVLVVDNCPAHPKISTLTNIKLIFLPPNTTSLIQPLDQGIIRSLKCHYRKIQQLNHLETVESGKPYVVANVYEAIVNIHRAWNLVTSVTIKNCFGFAGFGSGTADEFSTDDDIPLSQWLEKFRSTNELPNLPIEWQEMVGIDDNVITTAEMTDAEILEEVSEGNLLEAVSDANNFLFNDFQQFIFL